MHFEQARGSDDDNQKYCSKENNFRIWGHPNEASASKWTRIIEAATGSLQDAMDIDHEYTCKHFTQLQAIVKALEGGELLPDYRVLYEWQTKALKMIQAQDDRQILFVVDHKGGTGKSTFANYLRRNYGAWGTNGESWSILINHSMSEP